MSVPPRGSGGGRPRFALVGTGARSGMYLHAICRTFAEHAELAGICDSSRVRMGFWNERIERWLGAPAPAYRAAEFGRMLDEQRPDAVIVCTVDATHHEYITAALERGCNVITEKPMTTDAPKARAILDAVEKTGRRVRVAFNYRWMVGATALRRVILEGAVGRPLLVDFMWTLDTSHGADYFRRWHREKDRSGGLLVHKATHHFDLVNFWVDSAPERVFALGGLRFYGRENAEARGEARPYDRYTGVPEARDDPFRLALDEHDGLRGLYLDAEAESGYLRDRCVFGEGITIEDTLGVLARYRNGVQLNYSLVAYSPWEGVRACVTGTRGRAELFETHGSHLMRGQSDSELAAEQRSLQGPMRTSGQFLNVYPMFGEPYEVDLPAAEGGHAGGDRLLLEQLFSPDPPADPFGRTADEIDGAASILLGIAANRSLETGQPVDVADLLELPSRD